MPCYTIRETPIVFEKIAHKAAHIEYLAKALADLGYTVRMQGRKLELVAPGQRGTGTYEKGTFNVPNNWNLDLNQVKEAYARQAVRAQAQRAGWRLKEISPTEFELERR